MRVLRTGRKHFHCFKAFWVSRYSAEADEQVRIERHKELVFLGMHPVEEQPARGKDYGFHRFNLSWRL